MTRAIFSSKVSSSAEPYVIEVDENVFDVLATDVEVDTTLGGELERDLLLLSFFEPLPLTCRSGTEGFEGLENKQTSKVNKMV